MPRNPRFDFSKVVVCETSPRPMERVYCVEANIGEGVLRSLRVGVKKDRTGEDMPFITFLDPYDFTASPEAWREIIPPLARFLGLNIHDRIHGPARKVVSHAAKLGRHAPPDTGLLVDAIRSAHCNGRPYHKTGRNGLYMRRAELPGELNTVGRDRLEMLADGLLNAGRVCQDENGTLTVPETLS